MDNKISPYRDWFSSLFSYVNSNLGNISSDLDFYSQILKQPTTQLSNVDLNNYINGGIYSIGATCSNAPPTLTGGKLLVIENEIINYARQIYIGGYDIKIYTRCRYYSNGWVWSAWYSLSMTNV